MLDVLKRGGHRAMVSRLIKEVESLLRSTVLDNIKLTSIVVMLRKQQVKMVALDELIQSKMDDDELVADMQEACDIDQRIEESIIEAELAIASVNINNGLGGNSGNIAGRTQGKFVKLPTIQLPVFTGEVLEWQHFWDVYQSSIHSRVDLTGSQKFSYLLGQLKGPALELLEGFSTTDCDYLEAVKLLENSYGDKRNMIKAHLHAIFDIKSPKASAAEIGSFRASFESHIRSLKSLGTKIDDAGFVIVALLMRKLPNEVRDNLNRRAGTQYWELPEFRDAINIEIGLLQSTEPEKGGSIKNANGKAQVGYEENLQNKFRKAGNNLKSSTANFQVNTKVSKKIISCRFCNGAHYNNQCDQYIDSKEKHNRVKELRLCFRCLSNNHSVAECKGKYNCRICEGSHHYLLCFKKDDSSKSAKEEDIGKSPVKEIVTKSVNLHQTKGAEVGIALPTAIVPIINRGTIHKIRALFDQGSQCTFMLKSVATKLGLKVIEIIKLSIDGFQSKGLLQNYEVVQIRVKTYKGSFDIKAVLIDKLPKRLHIPGIVSVISEMEALGVKLADPEICRDTITDISLLIGADQYYYFVEGIEKHKDMHLVSSNFGKMLSGKLFQGSTLETNSLSSVTMLEIATCSHDEELLDEQLKKLWTLDTIGIVEGGLSAEDELILKNFQDSLVYKDGHYTTRLPWRMDHPPLPLNYGMAKGRLQSTLCKLRKEENHLEIYNSIIEEQLKLKFIERVDSESQMIGSRCHYLAHHGVKKDSVTTPLRVVFDCSAGKPSLNDCLYTGPSMIYELSQIILRFRLGKFACVSDIAKAYLMIALDERDRDATRFLWPENPADSNSPLVVYRFKVVLFGATCCQFLLNATIRHHLTVNKGEITSTILRNLYIDNLQGTSNLDDKLVMFYKQSKLLFQDAGLTLREWATNSSVLQTEINNYGDGVSQSKSNIKMLGMMWDTENDIISFPRKILNEQADTKREVVRSVAKIFDPIGYLLPITIRSRMLIQALWKSKLGWDESFGNEFRREWSELCQDYVLVMGINFSRSVFSGVKVQLHAFSDASARAYGTVVLLTSEEKVQFCIAKARVAPVKALTIPQMELTAAAMAAQLAAFVIGTYSVELQFTSVHLWTDSQIVLRWINSKKQLKPYIRSRVDKIWENVKSGQWHYVPTHDNPADLLSRGMKAKHYLTSDLWNRGPSWLIDEQKWPTWEMGSEDVYDSGEEKNVLIEVAVSNIENTLIDVLRFGSLKKLLKVTILVFRAVNIFKSKLTKQLVSKSANKNDHEFTVQDYTEAENYWIQTMQLQHYPEVLECLKDSSKGKVNPLVQQLDLFLDNGLIRCRGRLQNSDLEYSAKYPFLMSNKCHFTKLMIWESHERTFHAGVNCVVNYVRQKWWIPKLRTFIKTIIGGCVVCKKLQGSHYRVPPPPPLPSERIKESRPFSIVGVDLTGALNVYFGKLGIKVYIVLFTCAVTRAVHLEIIESNSGEDFIRGFRRFISRRSIPSVVYSDNAKNFRYASMHLARLQRNSKVRDFFAGHRVQWRFIPARAPWFGGFWERLIGLTKNTLKKVMGKAFVSVEELRTLVAEVEMRINDRPLTYVSDNVNDLTAITPSELLYGYKLNCLPNLVELPEDIDFGDRALLSKRQNRCAIILKHFWTRWQNEYLAALREKGITKTVGGSLNIEVGDIVLIREDSARVNWKLGLITEFKLGSDGFVRSALVKTAYGQTHRPIAKLYPLEVNHAMDIPTSDKSDTETDTGNPTSERPPHRAAGLRARDRIASQLNN